MSSEGNTQNIAGQSAKIGDVNGPVPAPIKQPVDAGTYQRPESIKTIDAIEQAGASQPRPIQYFQGEGMLPGHAQSVQSMMGAGQRSGGSIAGALDTIEQAKQQFGKPELAAAGSSPALFNPATATEDQDTLAQILAGISGGNI